MNESEENAAEMNKEENIQKEEQPFDYDHVKSVARIAAYDDLQSAPRMTIIEPAPTDEFITDLATKVYEQAKMMGGKIPFTIIKEVSENFIHAKFEEMTVSILDGGNTIRFADQGPGINHKDKAKLPGFSSATEPMKNYIRGVGSGLPIVQDYFDERHGTVTIDDNVLRGAVVTISLKNTDEEEEEDGDFDAPKNPPLYERNRTTTAQEPGAFYQQQPAHPSLQQGTLYQTQQQQMPAPYYQPQEQIYQQNYNQQQTSYVPQTAYHQNGYPQQFEAYQNFDNRQSQISMVGANHRVPMYIPQTSTISERGKQCLLVLQSEGMLGVTEVAALTGIPQASVFNELKKLEESGFIEKTAGKKRVLTNIGQAAANSL